jgi:heat shock protein HtpX
MTNNMKTFALLTLLTVFLVVMGDLLGGRQGMIIAFVFAVVMNFGSYWFSDKLVLSMYRAKEISPGEHPRLHEMVRRLSQSAGIPMPKLYVVPQPALNAFATGRNPGHAVVAVTEGLLAHLKEEEIEGVIAHELAHVKNRDILVGTIAATMAGAIMILASMARWAAIFGGGGRDNDRGSPLALIVTAIVAPMAAMIIQMAISRTREYKADASGASFAHSSEGLAKALEKLSMASGKLPMAASQSTGHMMIVNPLSGKSLMRLFSTHPPIEERIARLRKMRTL